jgi:hypothetical protein
MPRTTPKATSTPPTTFSKEGFMAFSLAGEKEK